MFIANSVVPPITLKSTSLIADSGCSQHYDGIHTLNKSKVVLPVTVSLPNGDRMTSSHTRTLNIPTLPPEACTQHLFPQMTTTGLLSIGQLCDHGCTATLSRHRIVIRNKSGAIIIVGHRRGPNSMWLVDLDDNTPTTSLLPTCNAIILSETTKKDLAQFHHASLGSPVTSTLLSSIDAGFLASFPGLTKKLVKKHLPKSEHTSKGHLDQERQHLQSTRPPPLSKSKHDAKPESKSFNKVKVEPDIIVSNPDPTERTNLFIHAIVPATDKIYTDLTGKFPVQSALGNKYILIVYHYDANAIIAEPLKDRTAGSIAKAHERVYDYLTARGLAPKVEILDNECSAELVRLMRKRKIAFQLVPPHLHRANAAERAIRTWKNHFISILCGLDPRFPLQLWDRLIDQTNLTLNLMRASRINPKMAAEAMLNGPYDFNRTPIAPLGTKCIVHEKPAVHGTWAPHGVDGWYIGPARDHYRCYSVYVPSTKGVRVSETVEFFPFHVSMPATSSVDMATETAKDLIHLLRHPAPAAPFAVLGTRTSEALTQLADIFAQLKPRPPPATQTRNTALPVGQ